MDTDRSAEWCFFLSQILKLFLERNHSNIREEDLVVTAIGVFLMCGKKKP